MTSKVRLRLLKEERRPNKSIRIDGNRGLLVHWARFCRRLGAGTPPSTSSLVEESASGGDFHLRCDIQGECQRKDDAEVDEVIVDRSWSEEIKSSVSLSEQNLSLEQPGSLHLNPGSGTDRESVALHDNGGFWNLCTPLTVLRWRLFPAIMDFLSPKFPNQKSELHYVKENWFMRKPLAMWSSLFLVVNWAVNAALVPGPVLLIDKIFLYGVSPASTVPVLVLVIYDWPRDRSNAYQVVLAISIWCWGVYQLLYIFLCGLYNPNFSTFRCGRRDFLSMFYFTCAVPTVALFGLRQKRLPAVLCATVWACLFGHEVGLPDQVSLCARSLIRVSLFLSDILNFIIFQGFLVGVHYMLETSERKLYILRDQLKVQFRATQKAQINERLAADSKRRLTSWATFFMLAVQNMEAAGIVPRAQEIEFKALEGSLSIMSKVLNDVLDFNRMDSGRFESVSRPYSFHQVIRGLFVPLRLATDARRLELVTDLDPCIDKARLFNIQIARDAVYVARGLDLENVQEQDGDGLVVGDETRLMQIITNLASNACKFTPPGGRLRITTRLIVPACLHHDESTDDGAKVGESIEIAEKRSEGMRMGDAPGLPMHSFDRDNGLHEPQRDWIVVRVEVTDTGYGIPPKEMVQSKLFSAFNQTEQGKQQGGKGTGLGLALVRQIVKRSGGRLGVRSHVGRGSTFWVELPLGIGSQAIVSRTPALPPVSDTGLSKCRSNHIPTSLPNDIPCERASTSRLIIEDLPLKASAVPSTGSGSGTLSPLGSRRSLFAMHGLMEQGGLVEIGPKAGGSSSVITRTIGDALALPPAPEEAENPADTLILPPPLSMTIPSLPSSILPTLDTPGIPCQTPSTSEISEALATSTSQSPSLVLIQPQSHPSLGGPGRLPASFRQGLRVLVVDDDTLTRVLMFRLLTRLGCEVSIAENGEVALGMVLSNDGGGFAVIFLDNQMPVMSGLSMVTKLRKAGRNDFVVGVTGNALLSDQEEYLKAGVDRVLIKPVLECGLRSMLVLASERLAANPAEKTHG
ncbi:hypothetical protein F5148DRAFT_1277243 [Russula earlei]|uniref:Uncharacterized protein n=1 Tax=Russula earlei TaxID=71964 RepID=A0ACC0TZS3_9AGAM|nr:hypothetical protein F5148DRAFT_1277243 [Russula earlei]